MGGRPAAAWSESVDGTVLTFVQVPIVRDPADDAAFVSFFFGPELTRAAVDRIIGSISWDEGLLRDDLEAYHAPGSSPPPEAT